MEKLPTQFFLKTLFIGLLLLSLNATRAQDFKPYDLGASLCYWLNGDVNVEGYKIEKDGSLILRLFADYYLIEKFAMGMYINRSISSGLKDIYDEKANMTEFGMSFKPRLPIQPNFTIKPGLNIGYRVITFPDNSDYNINALGINFSTELQFHLETKGIVSGEVGFLSQPSGGNDYANVTFAPIIYLGVGYTF